MSLIECPEPDWNEICTKSLAIEEILFDLDEHLINEINKTFATVNENVNHKKWLRPNSIYLLIFL